MDVCMDGHLRPILLGRLFGVDLKMSFFNKINDVLIVDALEKVSQRRNSEVLTLDVLQVRTLQQNCIVADIRC